MYPRGRRKDLYAYLWGIHKNLDCHVYRIGGVEDHVHIFTDLHPSIALAKYIETIKTSSTSWIRRENVFRGWPGWQDGYAAFTSSYAEKDSIIEYIKTQEKHHKTVSYLDELKALLKKAGIPFEPKYLE